MVDLFRTRNWDLVGRRNIWFAISLLVILSGMYALVTKGLNLGIDFTGGGLVTYRLAEPVASGQESAVLAKARQAVGRAGVDARVQIAGDALSKDQILIRTRILQQQGKTADELLREQDQLISAELTATFPGIARAALDRVSPVVSQQLLWNAVKAVSLGCVFILFWVWVRYAGYQWGGTALVALLHDVLVLLGVFAILQLEVNSPFVAAALTVVGYSVHDTVVIYDRIRENVRLRKAVTFAETCNISLLETLARSVNTVLTVEFVLITVYLFGGASLRTFAFAMMVGITAGAYSSIFTASQLLVVLKNREDRALEQRRRRTATPVQPAARRAARPVSPTPSPMRQAEKPSSTAPTPDEGAARAQDISPAPIAGGQKRPPSEAKARKKLKAVRKRKKRF